MQPTQSWIQSDTRQLCFFVRSGLPSHFQTFPNYNFSSEKLSKGHGWDFRLCFHNDFQNSKHCFSPYGHWRENWKFSLKPIRGILYHQVSTTSKVHKELQRTHMLIIYTLKSHSSVNQSLYTDSNGQKSQKTNDRSSIGELQLYQELPFSMTSTHQFLQTQKFIHVEKKTRRKSFLSKEHTFNSAHCKRHV